MKHNLMRFRQLDGSGIGKANFAQQFEPSLAREQWVRGPQLMVAESPPPVRQSEREIHPRFRERSFEKHHEALWPQEASNVLHGPGQIGGGVQNIGGDDDVIVSCREALSDRIFFDVQNLV
ncbi:MAG: hypothetical protein WA581_02990, partial [Candidatus Acidiferrales bacterium]